MATDKPVREHLVKLLEGGQAHVTFDAAVRGLPAALRGKKPKGAEHSAWEILEHIRIAQWDILEFSRDGKHVSPKWPEGYWPRHDELGNEALWKETVEKIRADLKQMEALVADTSTDLIAKIPHGSGQTILREALLIADHNSYHLGVLAVTGRILKG